MKSNNLKAYFSFTNFMVKKTKNKTTSDKLMYPPREYPLTNYEWLLEIVGSCLVKSVDNPSHAVLEIGRKNVYSPTN